MEAVGVGGMRKYTESDRENERKREREKSKKKTSLSVGELASPMFLSHMKTLRVQKWNKKKNRNESILRT